MQRIRRCPENLQFDRPLDHFRLKRESRKRDVDSDPTGYLKQDHAMAEGKFQTIRDAGLETPQKFLDERCFLSETGQQREINITRQPRLSPLLNRQAAYKAKPPVPILNDSLNFNGDINQVDHRLHRSRMKTACWSTSPELDRGGSVLTAHRNAFDKDWIALAVSTDASARRRLCFSSHQACFQVAAH